MRGYGPTFLALMLAGLLAIIAAGPLVWRVLATLDTIATP